MPGTRLFFLLCLVVGLVIFAAAGAGSLTSADMPAAARSGLRVWTANGCEGCHTLFGAGGAYAPDLTHIYSQRGEDYLREFLANPSAFHPGQRVMPVFGLTASETEGLFAFLSWTNEQSVAQNWPPQPITVSGGGLSVASAETGSGDELPEDPAERGLHWFQRPPAICGTCHSLEPDVVVVGPSLAGIAARAAERIPGMTAEQYLRESIINPSDFLVPGFPDVMAKNFGSSLTADQINDILAFLMTLE